MSLLHPTIRDEEGKRLGLALTNPIEQLVRPTERGGRLREAGLRLQRLPTAREWGQIALYMVPALPLILAGGVAPAVISRSGAPHWAMFLATIPLGAIPAIVTVLTLRLAMREMIAGVNLEAGYCPSCAYDLRATEVDAGGRRRCAECGGVWRPIAA